MENKIVLITFIFKKYLKYRKLVENISSFQIDSYSKNIKELLLKFFLKNCFLRIVFKKCSQTCSEFPFLSLTSWVDVAAGQAIPHNSSEASHYDGRALELTKGEGKQYPTEEGSSCQTEDDVKGNNIIFRSKDGTDQATTEAFSFESPAIRPGIAADLKFGGSGSHPNLPWVSTIGPGPNGKTISGVTYRYSRDQIKIVCACHGSHMSPEEFVQHASEENGDPED